MSTTPLTSYTSSTVITADNNPVLKLRKKKAVKWEENVIDNENMNKKKSKSTPYKSLYYYYDKALNYFPTIVMKYFAFLN